jgi:hypothetical protein
VLLCMMYLGQPLLLGYLVGSREMGSERDDSG